MRQNRVCKISVSESISAYMDSMLDGRSMRRISRHLKYCEDCRAALSELMQIRASMRESRKSTAPSTEEFWSNAFRSARLADEAQTGASANPPACDFILPRTRYTLRRTIGYAVAAALAIAAIAAPFSMGGHSPVGQPAEAAESVDIDAIIGSHAHAILHEPFVNRPRAVMIESESAAQQTGNTVDEAVFDIDQTSTDQPPAIQ